MAAATAAELALALDGEIALVIGDRESRAFEPILAEELVDAEVADTVPFTDKRQIGEGRDVIDRKRRSRRADPPCPSWSRDRDRSPAISRISGCCSSAPSPSARPARRKSIRARASVVPVIVEDESAVRRSEAVALGHVDPTRGRRARNTDVPRDRCRSRSCRTGAAGPRQPRARRREIANSIFRESSGIGPPDTALAMSAPVIADLEVDGYRACRP